MNELSSYLGLCVEVYDLSKPKPPEDAYAFYRSYALRAKGLILEPMCGTGRFLLPLLEEGFNVHGVDVSDYMLQKLHVKARAANLNPTVWKGYTEELKIQTKYDLIYIPSGSFCLITEKTAVKSMLKAFYDHLSDEGILLFEVETLKAVPQTDLWRGYVWHKSNGQIIALSQLATFKDNICSSICRYELIDRNNIIHTEIEELKVRIYGSDELTETLKSCGFQNIRTIKAFDINQKPDINDLSIVYEGRKDKSRAA